jgi:hypothetical protein
MKIQKILGSGKRLEAGKREDGSFCTLAFTSVILEEELLGSTRKEVGSGERLEDGSAKMEVFAPLAFSSVILEEELLGSTRKKREVERGWKMEARRWKFCPAQVLKDGKL